MQIEIDSFLIISIERKMRLACKKTLLKPIENRLKLDKKSTSLFKRSQEKKQLI